MEHEVEEIGTVGGGAARNGTADTCGSTDRAIYASHTTYCYTMGSSTAHPANRDGDWSRKGAAAVPATD